MINMRSEFDKMMKDYGHFSLLVRNNKTIRCSCWNDKTQEASKGCNLCFGRGFLSTVEKHICRSMITSVPETLSRSIKQLDYGLLSIPSRVFYFKHSVAPKAKDLIIDCQFDSKGLPKLNDRTIFEINSVDLHRGDKGRVEFIKVYCSPDPVEADIVITNIRKSGINIVYDAGLRR